MILATENRQGAGQVKTDEKSKANTAGIGTITAIPELLEKIALEGYIVTIDASDFSDFSPRPQVASTK